MKLTIGFLTAVLFVGLFVTTATWGSQADEESDFLRFVKAGKGEGRLETANVTYQRDDGVEVTLVGAVHVADGEYYGKLEKLFAGYDALLYEMIKPKGVEPIPRPGSGSMLSVFQRGLKDVLKLQFQLDAIDYTRKNFVHADLDPTTFSRLQKERGENLLTLMLRAMLAGYKRQAEGKGSNLGLFELIAAFASDDSARALKYLLAREFENVELVLAGFEKGKDGKGSVIVTERNKEAIRVLRREIKKGKKRLGIFYGAAHMPDLEKRLVRDLGFKKTKEEWVTAWDIRGKKGQPVQGGGKQRRKRQRV